MKPTEHSQEPELTKAQKKTIKLDKILHNTVSNKALKEAAMKDTTPRTTVSFYRYFDIVDPQAFRDELYKQFRAIGVLGRIYIATEGINAQISVPTANVEALRTAIYTADPALNNLRLNFAIEEPGMAFWVLRFKVRDKIVADGIDDPGFSVSNTGTYLGPAEVNAMIDDPDAIFVDMRNHYEYEVGRFEGAIEVPSDTFREQLPMALEMFKDQKDKKMVMYCTGGIRCEKATAYMRHHGFDNVYHVEGGIIDYTRKAKEQGLDVRFHGKNFVFDERMGERITDHVLSTCHQCGSTCDTHVNCANDNCHLLFIQCPSCAVKYDNCCTPACQDIAKLPADERKALRKGKANDSQVFNKHRRTNLLI